MGFKLNIGKEGGGGSTNFSLQQSLNMIKAKGMSSQMVGTDVMKDGYYNTVNESGAGSPSNFNKGLEQASADGKLTGKFKELVDAAPTAMNDYGGSSMNKNADGGIYARSCFNMNDGTMAYQTDGTYVKTKEEEGYMSGVTRGGNTPADGDVFESDNDSQGTSTSTTVTGQNNTGTRAQQGRGVKVKRKINTTEKDDRQYYPENHPKAGELKP